MRYKVYGFLLGAAILAAGTDCFRQCGFEHYTEIIEHGILVCLCIYFGFCVSKHVGDVEFERALCEGAYSELEKMHLHLKSVKLEKERLQGVMEMAGAVCHEFSQPLQAAIGHMCLIEMGHDRERHLKGLSIEVNRMCVLMHKFGDVKEYKIKKYLEDMDIVDINKSTGCVGGD